MSRKARVVSLFRERFVSRDDCFAMQLPDGTYSLIRETLTDEVIGRHLHGDLTLGLYPSPQSISKWLCIDIDTTVAAATQQIQDRLESLGVPFLTEFSGLKGLHVWVFLSQPVWNHLVRRFGHTITTRHEVFPKQNQVSPDGYGNLLKAPLGKHQVSGRWCLFVNDELNVLEDPYGVLETASTFDPTKMVSSEDRANTLPPEEVCESGSRSAFSASVTILRPPLVKDCIQHALRFGCDKGIRNMTAHILATELRNAGIPLEQSSLLLHNVWNPLNRPPLTGKEIERVVRSAYSRMPYQYGCRPGGKLRQAVRCHGSEQCVFYTLLRSNNQEEEVDHESSNQPDQWLQEDQE